jgi:hypothetical protein
MAKDFTQREGIDYNETFSPISCKNSFRIIMALVAHYNLELHQMDVKITFLNGDLEENIYMAQPKGFVVKRKSNGMPPKEIDLWVKASFKTMIFEV